MLSPRLMLASIGGDSGKTLAAVGIVAAWRRDGIAISPFKKGPDYIDSAWLTLAAGKTTRNLDTWMMGSEAVLRSFIQNAEGHGISLIEANRGLHDGENARGTHSSAELSKLLKSPVVLVLPTTKTTRTVAAIALGVKVFDPEVQVSGVILNRVSTSRQESIIREAVEKEAGLPVLGAIPRIKDGLVPSRHLGLVTPEECGLARHLIDHAAGIIRQSVDLDKLRAIAGFAAPLDVPVPYETVKIAHGQGLRIGVFKSPAFTFYYPENLEALDLCGAIRLPIDPLQDPELPELDLLYIGGGFPETHAASLSANAGFRESVRKAVQDGLPVWAECGGLMFMSQSVYWQGSCFPMAGVFPVDIVLGDSPAGHGYEEVVVDGANPFAGIGTTLRGHEFHYSRIESKEQLNTVFEVRRGTGLGSGRDGMVVNNALASYLHLHSLGTPEWGQWLINAAAKHKASRRCGL